MNIAVIGCTPTLPLEFPLSIPENSGNMIHAQAPLKMFDNAIYHKNRYFQLSGEKSFKNFVNKTCSHVIITMANTLTIEKDDNEKYVRLRNSLEQYEVPIIVFGLGIQSKDRNLENTKMSKEAINLIEFLSSKAKLLGVRGHYTKAVIEKHCNVNNIYVTGCPSLFSNPEGLKKLKNRCKINKEQKGSVNVTNMAKEEERRLLARGIIHNDFLIEPVSRFSHKYYLELLKSKEVELPYFLNGILKKGYEGIKSKKEIDDYYKLNYKLFRDPKTWFEFNEEHVEFSYGTRFHVNMASILSGNPALWLTHDERTRELVEFFHLPNLDLGDSIKMSYEDMIEKIDYSDFFSVIDNLFNNFNTYLIKNGLPRINDLKD